MTTFQSYLPRAHYYSIGNMLVFGYSSLIAKRRRQTLRSVIATLVRESSDVTGASLATVICRGNPQIGRLTPGSWPFLLKAFIACTMRVAG